MSGAGLSAKILKDFDQNKFKELLQKFSNDNQQINVGIPAGIDHKEEGGQGSSGLTVAQVAAVHEFGAPDIGIPERSFLRSAINENRPKYIALNRQSLKGVFDGTVTMTQALGYLGEMAKGHVQEKIKNGPFTPLKPATIARKGSSKPLIDSGQTRQSVQWEFANDRDKRPA